jgi:hypothetical protein
MGLQLQLLCSLRSTTLERALRRGRSLAGAGMISNASTPRGANPRRLSLGKHFRLCGSEARVPSTQDRNARPQPRRLRPARKAINVASNIRSCEYSGRFAPCIFLKSFAAVKTGVLRSKPQTEVRRPCVGAGLGQSGFDSRRLRLEPVCLSPRIPLGAVSLESLYPKGTTHSRRSDSRANSNPAAHSRVHNNGGEP